MNTCRRSPDIPDLVIFSKLILVLVLGSEYLLKKHKHVLSNNREYREQIGNPKTETHSGKGTKLYSKCKGLVLHIIYLKT